VQEKNTSHKILTFPASIDSQDIPPIPQTNAISYNRVEDDDKKKQTFTQEAYCVIQQAHIVRMHLYEQDFSSCSYENEHYVEIVLRTPEKHYIHTSGKMSDSFCDPQKDMFWGGMSYFEETDENILTLWAKVYNIVLNSRYQILHVPRLTNTESGRLLNKRMDTTYLPPCVENIQYTSEYITNEK